MRNRYKCRTASQAAFSDVFYPQRFHNQPEHIGMAPAAGVIEVKRFIGDGIGGQHTMSAQRLSTTISRRIFEYCCNSGFNFGESTASAATAGALMRIKPDGVSKKWPYAWSSGLIG